MPRPDRPCAEIARTRDPETGRAVWVINHVVGERRIEIASSDSMRGILAEASRLEREGYYIARGGLAR